MPEKTRLFLYTGTPQLTRGDYGENLTQGYELDHDDTIHFFDSAFGDFVWGSIEWGFRSGSWKEIGKNNYILETRFRKGMSVEDREKLLKEEMDRIEEDWKVIEVEPIQEICVVIIGRRYIVEKKEK